MTGRGKRPRPSIKSVPQVSNWKLQAVEGLTGVFSDKVHRSLCCDCALARAIRFLRNIGYPFALLRFAKAVFITFRSSSFLNREVVAWSSNISCTSGLTSQRVAFLDPNVGNSDVHPNPSIVSRMPRRACFDILRVASRFVCSSAFVTTLRRCARMCFATSMTRCWSERSSSVVA